MFNRASWRVRACSALAGAGLVMAMSAATVAGDEQEKPAGDDPSQVLRGPQVEDRDVPGADSTFGDSEMKPMRDRERRVSNRAFMMAMRGLMGEDVAPEIRATDEQREEVRGIEREFREARRAYMDEHRDEVRELMETIRPRGQGPAGRERGERGERGRRGERGEEGRRGRGDRGDRPGRGGEGARGPRDDGPGPRGRINPDELNEEQRAAFERLKEIRAAGPQPEAYHTRMWEVLSEAQHEFVEGRLKEIQQRNEEARQRRKDAQRGARGPREGARPGGDRERRRDRD